MSFIRATPVGQSRYIVVRSSAPAGPVFRFSSVVKSYKIVVRGLIPGMGGGGESVDLTNYLKRDGTDAMTGSLNMAGNAVKNVPAPFQSDHAANMGYVDSKVNVVYTHNQSVPSASWMIPHGLGKLYPFITVLNSAGEEIGGIDSSPIDMNNTVLNWISAFGGIAYLR